MLLIKTIFFGPRFVFAAFLCIFVLGLFGSGAMADSTNTVPHGTYTSNTDMCLRCHKLHAAPKRWQDDRKGTFLINQSDEKALCYTCHDGTVSAYNVIAEFGDNLNGVSTRVSSHPVSEGTIVCSGCHSPHKQVENFDATHTADEVIRLLRGYSTGNIFGFVIDNANTAWNNIPANPTFNYPAQNKLSNQNDMCGSCHGAASALPGGDHLSNFNGTPHDVDTLDPVAPARSKIKCENCHTWHGSDMYPLLESTISGNAISGNDNSICFSCHTLAVGAYSGQIMYQGIKHSTVVTSSIANTTWPVGGYEPGYCLNCHNPHGTAATDYRRALDNDLCVTCHDDAGKTIPPTYSYKGIADYDLTPHASESNLATIWPFSVETGSGVGTGGSTAGQCINCHNPHGQDAGGAAPFPKLTMRSEENLCFGGGTTACHASAGGSINSINIYERFTANADNRAHHNISDADQAAAVSKVECLDCHDSHTNTVAYMSSDPDDRTNNFTTKVNDITLYPKAVIQPRAEGKDVYIWSLFGDSNWGNSESLVVGKKAGYVARTVIEFDISSIPTNANVTSAVLALPEIPAGGGSGSMTIDVHRNTTSWSEGTVTWNNPPTIAFTPVASAVSDNTTAWREWTITGQTQNWLDGTDDNHGVTLKATNAVEVGPNLWREYLSSDNVYSPGQARAARPKLTVQYTSATPPKVVNNLVFCGKCHDGVAPPDVTMPGSVRQILPNYTNTGATGEYHGGLVSTGPSSGSGLGFSDELEGPYYFGTGSLLCSDCHDSHGSANAFGLKETVNGQTGITVPLVVDSSNYRQVQKFCSSCHTFTHPLGPNCFSCHYHGANYDRLNGVPGKANAYF